MTLSARQRQFQEQLQQNLRLRVRLYKNKRSGVALGTWANPVLTLPTPLFVKGVQVSVSGDGLDLKFYYSHDGVAYQAWDVVRAESGTQQLEFETPVWCRYVKVQTLAQDGAESNPTTFASPPYAFEEEWFDVSSFVRDGVSVELGKDAELGVYRMRHGSVPLDNSTRAFSRRNAASPFWDTVHDLPYYRANAKLMVEVMFRGLDGEIPMVGGAEEWVPLVTFHADEWRKSSSGKVVTASGDSGKVLLKTQTTQPVLEVVTPLELLRDRLVRDDDTQRLLIGVNPAARQKTETVVNEYVGEGITFGDAWEDVIPMDETQLIAVAHPDNKTDDESGFTLQLATTDGQKKRFGMCTNGQYIFALLYHRLSGGSRWWLEKYSMEGVFLGSRVVDQMFGATGNEYVPDCCTDGEWVFVTYNVVSRLVIRKVRVDLSGGWQTVVDLNPENPQVNWFEGWGIGFLPKSVGYPEGRILVAGVELAETTNNSKNVFWTINPVTGAAVKTVYQSPVGTAYWIDFIHVFSWDAVLGRKHGNSTVWEFRGEDIANFVANRKTHTITLADYGGPIFGTGRTISMLRTVEGFGVVARVGFWLENGNIQYDGASGFDEDVAFAQPLVLVDEQQKDRTGTVANGVLTTDDYTLNLYTGELSFKALLKHRARVKASYDYKYSLSYVRIEEENRLKAISDVAVSNNFVVYANAFNELQFRDRRYEEVLVCSDGTTVVTNKRLGDTYASGGLPYIVHDSNVVYAPWRTVEVFSADRATVLSEGLDFSVAYTGGRHFISFMGTALVHRVRRVRVTYRVQESIPTLKDVWHLVDDQEVWGDKEIMNDVTVSGEKMIPGDNAITVQQIFAVSPNEKKGASRFSHVQQADPEGLFDWNPDRKVVDDDSKPDALKKYFVEFESPFVLGTTGYEVVYGDGRDGVAGGGQYGILKSGSQTHNGNAASARFYLVTLAVTARDAEYFVLLDNNREWRVATGADFADMAGNTTGPEPANANDVKTTTKFYLKQMNGNYGMRSVNYVAYYTRRVRYYLDRNGRVIEDAAFDPNDRTKNPLTTVTADKRAAITLTPEDERQQPLFPYHGVSGVSGYFSGLPAVAGMNYFAGVYPAFSERVTRVWADMLGVNWDYDAWSAEQVFVRVETTGFPLTVIEKFEGRAPASNTDIEVYGRRERKFENRFIQNIASARNLAWAIKRMNSDEPGRYKAQGVFDPTLEPDMLVRVVSSFDGIDELFEVLEVRHTLSVGSPSVTDLVLEEIE